MAADEHAVPLGTVLSLYDIEMQYWHAKSRLMEELRAQGKP